LSTIKITFDDKMYETEPGLTVIQAADRLGVFIPRFCYLEKLSPLGGCRMCLVTLKGVPKLQTACTTPAKDGMEIITRSEEIHKARKAMLEFQLAQHPLDCFYCDKATECDLQDLTYLFADIEHRYDFPPHKRGTVYENRLIERNLERCVHCERCIRVCGEIQGAHAIAATKRGRVTEMREVPGGGECQYCGHCIDVCPVGANLDRLFTYGGRPFQMEMGDSICPYCGCGCTVSLNMRDEKLVRVRPGVDTGVNKGSLCARGRFGWGFVHDPARLTRPLIRKEGKFVEAGWDETLLYVATRLEKIIKEKGPGVVGGIGSVRSTDEANYLFQRFLRTVIGSNHIDSSARLNYAAALAGWLGTKEDAREATFENVREAHRVLVIGADPLETNPILGLAIKAMQNRGGTLWIADPRVTLTTRLSNRHFPISPGAEVPLILALARAGLKDPSLSEFRDTDLAARTGLSSEDLAELAAFLEEDAAKTVILAGRGVTQAPFGATAISLLLRLAATKGASYLFTLDKNNERGSCEMGVLPDRLPGLAPLSEKARFEKAWGGRIPETPGYSAYEMLQAAREGKLSALYIMGENPLVDFPDTKFVEEALGSLDFLVVQDLFRTRTASMADVVLPAASFAEKSGSFTNLEGRVQRFPSLIPTEEGVRADARILVELSRKMGKGFALKNIASLRAEIDSLVPMNGTRRKLEVMGPSLSLPGAEMHWGPGEDPDYPYVLLLTSSLYRNGSMSNRAVGLKKAQQKACVLLNEGDAAVLKTGEGDKVMLISKYGEIQVGVKLCHEIPGGTLQMPEGFSDANPKSLLPHELDPVSRTPMARFVRVKIRKI